MPVLTATILLIHETAFVRPMHFQTIRTKLVLALAALIINASAAICNLLMFDWLTVGIFLQRLVDIKVILICTLHIHLHTIETLFTCDRFKTAMVARTAS